ncbi:hypothetical protein A2480_00235 [Candidatus Uhrbacteria bacterium RIFOXYC2_FULL_47_19]|uniref:Uncharacterized protein n=1 Tax=Candidatus Uhrbacteria bacterium RIFOXYC2_FULL_47_19 TaxID=1802424 RepID=A0A1F7WEE8_9BACT|nr:MAG: hypothetical protein A2480_00235 [Candidatus Uhrbacteria bacterium RIFOXYC2_FULL_47_19]
MSEMIYSYSFIKLISSKKLSEEILFVDNYDDSIAQVFVVNTIFEIGDDMQSAAAKHDPFLKRNRRLFRRNPTLQCLDWTVTDLKTF